jgi:hypothetical protein
LTLNLLTLEVVIYLDVDGLSHEFESGVFAVAAGRKMLVRDARNFMVLSVNRVVNNFVNAGIWDFVPGLKHVANGGHKRLHESRVVPHHPTT